MYNIKDIIIKQVTSIDELEEIWKIDYEEYKESNISKDILFKWWNTYKEGLYIVKKNMVVIAGLGIWPLSKDVYNNLKNGSINEFELDVLNKNTSKYWYISGIVVIKKYRSIILRYILYSIIKNWYKNQLKSNFVTIGSIAISIEGKNLLIKNGFSLLKNNNKRKNNFQFFEIFTSKKDVKKIITKYSKIYTR